MTEYWVSKKQYWCKYCNIFIRDDAPSKKHHETGLKHIGNRERYIRDLYKSGNKAKLDRAEEAAELAKIEAAALKSGDTATKLTLLESLRAKQAALRAGGHKARDSRPKDTFANYTSAADLGFKDEETEKSSYEIEQELKGRAGEVGGWETVDYEPTGAYTGDDAEGADDRGEGSSGGAGAYGYGYGYGEKRKLGQYDIKDEEDPESFDFIRRHDEEPASSSSGPGGAVGPSTSGDSGGGANGQLPAQPPKRKPRLDPYDEDDWDPRAAIKGKVKSAPGLAADGRRTQKHVEATNLDREAWTGKLDLMAEGGGAGMMYVPGGGWVKAEGVKEEDTERVADQGEGGNDEDTKPDVQGLEKDLKPDVVVLTGAIAPSAAVTASGAPTGTTAETIKAEAAEPAGGLFKKRRPPPSSRKK